MTLKHHKTLTVERWNAISWKDRLLNILTELYRLRNALKLHNHDTITALLERALELIDLTVCSNIESKSPYFLKELLLFRSLLVKVYFQNISLEEMNVVIRGFLNLDSQIYNMKLKI